MPTRVIRPESRLSTSRWSAKLKLLYFRVVFGPELVMLGPDEQFTQLSLSGGKPKRPNVIKALCLLLGPDFCTDIITVETADHARLSLQLAYNW